MTQQANIAAAFLRTTSAINTLSGRVGTLSALTSTDRSSLVAALNELRAIVSGMGAGVAIDDGAASTSAVWSSSRTAGQITAAITALINGAPSAQDTLAELAEQITALAAADGSLLSFGGPQTLSPAQQAQAGANLGTGDPAWDYVLAINTALEGSGL